MYEGQVESVDLLACYRVDVLHLDSDVRPASDARVEARKFCTASRPSLCLLDVQADDELVRAPLVGADTDALDGGRQVERLVQVVGEFREAADGGYWGMVSDPTCSWNSTTSFAKL